MSISTIIFTCFALIFCVIYYLSRLKFNYWKKKKVPYLKPMSFFGNFKNYILLKMYYPQITQDICQQFPDEPCVGVFFGTEPALIVKDPEIIKSVLTKDFYYFNGRQLTKYSHKETATENSIFFAHGDRWKFIRHNLTPLFSSAKMKTMFPLIAKCASKLDSWLAEEVSECSTIDVKSVTASYTMDCIGSCVFGVNVNTMTRTSELNPFKTVGASMLNARTGLGLKIVCRSLWPAIFYALKFQLVDPNVSQFFKKLLKDVFANRKYEQTERNDFIDLLLTLYKNKYVSGKGLNNLKTGQREDITVKVDDKFMASTCITMFAAGYETSAMTLGYTLYELAKSKDAQAKAIRDVDNYWLRHTEIEYDCVSEMPYVDACLDETLRLYPVLGVITREVMDDYVLPTGVHLDKGLRVHIPVYYLHHNPKHFPEPEQFRPERFYGEEKAHVTPYTFLPFGEGPRLCIGWRFSKMQTLSFLATVLRRYRVELAEGMPSKLQFEPRTINTQPKGKIMLRFIARSNPNKKTKNC